MRTIALDPSRLSGVTLDPYGAPPDRHDPQASSTLVAPEQWFVNFATGNPTGEAGPAVNEFTAFNYLAVYDCVSLIASKIAELPLVTYRDAGTSKKPAKDRSEYELLLTEWNAETGAMIAREASIGHLLTWGNSYAQIVWNKAGTKVIELRLLTPDLTRPTRTTTGAVVYEVYRRGTAELIDTLTSDEVLHVPGLSFDGLVGYSPIRVAKSAIRSGMAQDREAEKFITGGIRPPGAIKFPTGTKFRDEADAIQYRDRFLRIHGGPDSARQALVLENGADWVQLGVDPKSAQLLDSRRYSRKEICGMYRVPPHLIGDVDSSTSWGTGIAEQTQGFVDFCLMGWMSRVEAEYKRKLGRDDPNVYYRHCTEALLRGDLLKRTQAREIQHRRGIITDNEWRVDEHMNPADGGDVRHFPLNEALVDETGEVTSPAGGQPDPGAPPADPTRPAPAPSPTEAAPDPGNARRAAKLRAALVAGALRCLRLEGRAAAKAAEKPGQFLAWVDEFYGRHAEMVADHCGHVAEFLGQPDYPARHVARSRAELLALADVPTSKLAESVERLAARWQAERIAEVAVEFAAPEVGPS
jgi:HK97 family phage portal protein